MGNQASRSFDGLIEQLNDCYAGAVLHALVIVLLQNPAVSIALTLEILVGKPAGPGGDPAEVMGVKQKWADARAAKLAASKAYQASLMAGREQMFACIGSLRNLLGRFWNSLWIPVGFTTATLKVEDNPYAQLVQAGNYYASHPTQERPDVNGFDCSAAGCRAAAKAIKDAQAARNIADGAAAVAQGEFDAGMNAGRNRLIGVRTELDQLIASDDPRWKDYGFQMPAFMSAPGVPEGLVVKATLPGTLTSKWKNTKRADSFRLVIKDAAGTVLVDQIVWENQFTVENLTSGTTVTVEVSSRNITGESLPTAPVTITVA